MAFTRKPYCSLDQVKLGMDKQTDADDEFIRQQIALAQDAIDEYLGFSFQTDGTDAAPATRLYDGNNHSQMLIDRALSVSKVELLTYNVSTDPQTGAYIRSNGPTTDITGDVLLGPPNLSPGFLLTRLSEMSFPLGRQNIRVSGVFGIDTIPGRVQKAATLLAIHYVNLRDATYGDTTSSTPFGQVTYRNAIPQSVRELLDPIHRRLFLTR